MSEIFLKIQNDLDTTGELHDLLLEIFDHYMNSNQLTETQRNKLARIRAQVNIQLKDL
jgi:hypothetical protein